MNSLIVQTCFTDIHLKSNDKDSKKKIQQNVDFVQISGFAGTLCQAQICFCHSIFIVTQYIVFK